jgi:hypothetical protein
MKLFETKRVQNINFLMDDIHDSANQIYEHLIDEEFSELKEEVSSLIRTLKSVLESVEDEL